MGSLSSGAEEERETQREKMCVRFTLIIANCLLALLGLLLLAGGVWRIVDDGSLREVANEIRDTQEWDEKLTPGSKFVQNLFFGVSAGLSAIILFFTVTLCCRARREERVQGYVDAIQAYQDTFAYFNRFMK